MPNVVFKIPQNVVEAHPELRDWAWNAGEMVAFSDIVNGAPSNITLEAYPRNDRLIIRSANIGSMNRMRQYSNGLGGTKEPSDDEVAAVLASRNPERELRIDE